MPIHRSFRVPHSRTWRAKFRYAFRGLYLGIRGQKSFIVHLPMAVAVVICAGLLRVEFWEWMVLLLCITAVFTAELFNSAIETLGSAVDRHYNLRVGVALDIASAAVLVASLGASTVGAAIFLRRLWMW